MLVHVTLVRDTDRQLGIKLGGRRTEPGIFIMELMIGSVAEQDGRLQAHDRILAINSNDVRYARLPYAFQLIKQSAGHISLTVSRSPYFKGEYDHLFKPPNPDIVVNHSRTKSAPDRLVEQKQDFDTRDVSKTCIDVTDGFETANPDKSASCESLGDSPYNRVTQNCRLSTGKYTHCTSIGSFGEIDPINTSNYTVGSITSGLNKSSGSITMPTSRHLDDDDEEIIQQLNHSPPILPPRSRQPLGRTSSYDQIDEELNNNLELELNKATMNALPASGCADVVDGPIVSGRSKPRRSRDSDVNDLCANVKKSLRLDGNQLHQKTVTISKVLLHLHFI